MRYTLLLSLLLPLLLGSCAPMQGKPRMVIMENPKTMDFKNCEVNFWGLERHFKENEKCIERLKKKGYVIWASQ